MTVIDFYQKKIQGAVTLSDEEEIVKGFGSPEHVAQKLRESLGFAEESKAEPVPEKPQEEETQPTEETPAEETRIFTTGERVHRRPVRELAEKKAVKTLPVEEIKKPESEESFRETLFAEAEEEAEQGTLFPVDERPELNHLFPEIKEVFEDEPEEKKAGDGEIFPDAAPAASRFGEETDLIFSKPVSDGKAAEIIHAIENPEIKPIYGEKVKLEEPEEGEIIGISLSSPNDPTPEEVEEAKAQTLEKAKSFDSSSSETVVIREKTENLEAEKEYSSEKSKETEPVPEKEPVQTAMPIESEATEEEEKPSSRPGLFSRMLESSSLPGSVKKIIVVLLSVLVSPFVLLALCAVAVAFSVLIFGIVIVSIVLFILMVAFIIGGVIELVYGFAAMRDSVAVALIEIGIGTSLMGVVCAVSAMIYQFLFGVLPSTLKSLVKNCKRTLKWIISFLYGGKA